MYVNIFLYKPNKFDITNVKKTLYLTIIKSTFLSMNTEYSLRDSMAIKINT